MLGLGILFLGLGIFFFWVMMNGDNFITSGTWKDAVNQVGQAFKGWLGGTPVATNHGATPGSNSAPNASPNTPAQNLPYWNPAPGL